MVLLVFLIDTSASMNQRTCLGTTYLDLAKGAAESFLKIRSRDTNLSRGDRYMLVTYDEPSKSVKAGWRENLLTFQKELKNLEGSSVSNFGRALKDTFDLLNMHRLQSGIDNYGMGRNPYYLEPALIMMFSDGCSMIDVGGIIPEITFPTEYSLPGSELTKEMYRWDQRLFTLNLRIPGFASSVTENSSTIHPEDIPLGNLCEQTGGKLYNIISQKTLMQSMESIAQKIVIPGVTLSFEKVGPDPEVIQKEGANDVIEQDKGKENIEVPGEVETNKKLEMIAPMMNGFIPPPMFLDSELPNGGIFPMPNDVSKVQNGLLPSPLMMPLIPPMPPPILGMPGSPIRGMMPPPPPCPAGFPGLPRPPLIPFVPTNPILPPLQGNDLPPPPILPPLVNGNIKDGDINRVVKTEVEEAKPQLMNDIPIRRDENGLDPNLSNGTTSVSTISTAWQNQKRMIYVRTNVKGTVGHWPIPESFWPDSNDTKLAPRNSHPIVNFTCTATEAMAIDNMPFDKYELEPSPLTQYILERKQPNVAWQTYVSGSSPDSELGYPFGYLKAATNLQCVNFFVLPYNYHCIMPLLDELFKGHKCKPTPQWRQKFDDYLKTIPSYYAAPLRNALRRMGAPPNLMPDHMDGAMSYSVVSYLKKVRLQAKLDAERLTAFHSNPHIPEPKQINVPPSPIFTDGKTIDFKQLLIQKSPSILNKELELKKSEQKSKDDGPFRSFTTSGIPVLVQKCKARGFKNPFDIRRVEVLKQVSRMRTNFFHIDAVCNRLHEEDSKHQVSIVEMGNYQEHVTQNKPLREVDPSQARVHTFGNPFKLKQDQLAVDEADLNDNMVFGGLRKRPGESFNSGYGQRNKRRVNATPPPSRRPQGAPNTPPLLQAPLFLQVAGNPDHSAMKMEENIDIKNGKNEIEILNNTIDDNDLHPNSNQSELNNCKDPLKSDTSIDEQLKKLIGRNKRTANSVNHNDESSITSPIMSILQTSLEDLDERENEEIAMINEKDSAYNDINKFSSSSPILKTMHNHIRSPTRSDSSLSQNLRPPTIREAHLELQTLHSTKLRLEIWKAIRNKSDPQVIITIMDQLNVSVVAKHIFISDIISEADRFNLTRLIETLRSLLPDLGTVRR